MKRARHQTALVLGLFLSLGGCGLDGYHADLTAVHQGTPGCLDASCHPGFTAAGTVFWDLEGLEPAEGVDIVLIDIAGGETRVATTGPSGLFWAEHALTMGEVTFRVGDQLSLAHEMPGHAECNLCHQPGGVDASEGTLAAQDVFPPTLKSSSPAGGSEGVDLESEIALLFSEPLDPVSVSTATIRLQGPDGDHAVELVFTDGADTVLLRPVEPLMEASVYVVVAESSVTDLAGNRLEAQQQVELFTASDGVLRVTDSQPAAGASDVDPSDSIILWVEPSLDASSVGNDTVWLSEGCDPQGAEVSWSAEDAAIVLRPLVDLPGGTNCTLTTSGLVSEDGGAQEGSWTLAFTTWADGTAPRSVAGVPSPGSVAISPDVSVELGWSEALLEGSVSSDSLRVTTVDGEELAGNTALEGQVMRWTAESDLPAGSTVVVELASIPTDSAGNSGVQPAPWSFRVGASYDRSGPTVQGLSPAEGAVDVLTDVVLELLLNEDPDLTTIEAGVSVVSDSGEVPCVHSWDGEASMLVIEPLVELQATTPYEVQVSSALLDLSGNSAGERGLRFTTTSTGDAGAPTFDGLQSVEGVDTSTVRLVWNAATDFETPASDLLYHAYLATESGGQDYDDPTLTSDPGATELEVGGLSLGSDYWAVVRVEDGDGNMDANTVELSAMPVVGFAEVAHPIILEDCGDCHGVNRTAGGLDVTTYDLLMESGTVIPGDASSSSFANYGNHHGSGWFTTEDEGMVDAWIDQGALDN